MKLRILLAAALVCAWPGGPHARAQGHLPDLSWSRHDGLVDVRRVFCHPTAPRIAWVATDAGLIRTADAGRTWRAVPAAAAAKVSTVTTLRVCPADENLVVIGTGEKGVHLSEDGGKSWRRIDTDTQPLASAHVDTVGFADADPSWRTLRVSHGMAAAGLSITRDLGRTWDVQARDRYLAKFVSAGPNIVAAGSLASTEGRIWAIHRSGTDGYRWDHSNSGIRPTAPARTGGSWRIQMATRDGDILHSGDGGLTWQRMARFRSANWVSLFWTRGRTASTRILAGYDPRSRGLMLSAQWFDEDTAVARNRGLYVGRFIKSGASCRANANGSVYYVVLNDRLWIGRRGLPAKGPALVETWCSPSSVWVGHWRKLKVEGALHRHIRSVAEGQVTDAHVRAIAGSAASVHKYAGEMGFTVFARVRHSEGLGAVKVVTVDAMQLTRRPDTLLYDDGKHGDGKPGDGLYAGRVDFTDAVFSPDPRARRRAVFPGVGAMTVTVTDKRHRKAQWSTVVGVYAQPAPIDLTVVRDRSNQVMAEGPVEVVWTRSRGVASQLTCRATGPGPWRATWGTHTKQRGPQVDMNGRATLSFRISGDVDQELYVQLVDHHRHHGEVLDEPHYGFPVRLIGGGYLKAVTPAFQRVRIPVRELLPPGVYFLRGHGAGIALSVAKGGRPGRYVLDRVLLEP